MKHFLVDTSGALSHVGGETDGSGVFLALYVRGDDLLSVIRPTEQRFYHADGLGSIRFLTNESGNVIDGYTHTAFGDLLTHTGTDPQPYTFAGEPYDLNIGLLYNRARWFDPHVGRFTSTDPFVGVGHDPISLHRYLYADLDPIDKIDPSGRFSLATASLTIGTLTTLAVTGLSLAAGLDVRTSLALGLTAGILASQLAVPILVGATQAITTIYVTLGSTAGVGAALAFARLLSAVGIRPGSGSRPPIPAGITPAQFGRVVMQWGNGAAQALARIPQLTRVELLSRGVTYEMAIGETSTFASSLVTLPISAPLAAHFLWMRRPSFFSERCVEWNLMSHRYWLRTAAHRTSTSIWSLTETTWSFPRAEYSKWWENPKNQDPFILLSKLLRSRCTSGNIAAR